MASISDKLKPGDGLIFGAAVLDHKRRDRDQMADVGDGCGLTDLMLMKLTGVPETSKRSVSMISFPEYSRAASRYSTARRRSGLSQGSTLACSTLQCRPLDLAMASSG
jgi:hypothetical protein